MARTNESYFRSARGQMRKHLAVTGFVAGLLAGVPSRATADIIFSTVITTGAGFSCDGPFFGVTYKSGTCTSNGNSVSIMSAGGQTLTVSFIGLNFVPITATLGTQVIDMGVIQTTLSGPGTFFFREPTFRWWYPFQFALEIGIGIQSSDHAPVRGGKFWFHSVSPTTVVANYPSAYDPMLIDNDAVAPYDLVFGAFQAGPLTAGGSTKVTAVFGQYTAPEPATIVLTATGLFLLAGVAVSKGERLDARRFIKMRVSRSRPGGFLKATRDNHAADFLDANYDERRLAWSY